jgi:hypothetical protein
MRELLAIDQRSPVYNEGSRRGVLYAQSWALVHYLTFANPERMKQFRQFLASVRSLGPLVASGRDPQIRSQARDLLGRVAEMKNQPAAAAAPAVPTGEELAALASLGRTPAAPRHPARRPAPDVQRRPSARTSGPSARGRRERAATSPRSSAAPGRWCWSYKPTPDRFVCGRSSWPTWTSSRTRSDTPGSVSCGALPKPPFVLATYRAGAAGTGASATAGDAVAIELLPDGYEP